MRRFKKRQAPFRTFWAGERLSPLAWACLSSFIRDGHVVEIFAYENIPCPAGTVRRDASEIISQNEMFIAHGSPTRFSDLFRFTLLTKEGGWWIDTDVVRSGGAVPFLDIVFAEEERGIYNVAILKLPRGHRLAVDFLRRFGVLDEAYVLNAPWGATGPQLFTKIVLDLGEQRSQSSTSDLYPVHWMQSYQFWFPEFTETLVQRTGCSSFVHIWSSILTRVFGIQLMVERPLPGSYLDLLYDREGVYQQFKLRDVSADDARLRVNQAIAKEWFSKRRERCGVETPVAMRE